MTIMKSVTFLKTRMPAGGYVLERLEVAANEETAKLEVVSRTPISAHTTLIECTEAEMAMTQEEFGETSLSPPTVVYRDRYIEAAPVRQPPPPQQQAQQEESYPQIPMNDRPKVVDDMERPKPYEPDPTLATRIMGAAKSRLNPNGAHILMAAFMLGAMARGLGVGA